MYRIYLQSGTIETDSLQEALTSQKQGCYVEKKIMQTSEEYYNRDRLFERKVKTNDMKKPLIAVDIDNKKIVYDGCMITKCGMVIDLMNPDPATILIEDIAHGLANNCRWNGHTQRFWSVAQHCCMMYDMAHNGERLTGLFHDAEEAYWGDMIKPLKNIIAEKCPEIIERMRHLRMLIFDKFSIPEIGAATRSNDFTCLQIEFENIINSDILAAWTPKKAKKEWLKRYYSGIN